MSEPDLQQLARWRRELNDAVKLHESSISYFWPGRFNDDPDGTFWFALNRDDFEEVRQEAAGKPHHLTTSASCFESLADRTPADGSLSKDPDEPGQDWGDLADRFAREALDTDAWLWTSEGAAHVYCRVRALPAILAHLRDPGQTHIEAAAGLIREAWEVIEDAEATERGVREQRLYLQRPNEVFINRKHLVVAPGTSTHNLEDVYPDDPSARQDAARYPASAFHTYWAVRCLKAFDRRFAEVELGKDLERLTGQARAWAQQRLATQTALILAGAERADAQQLAYALITDLRLAGEETLAAGGQRHDLYEAALSAFFKAQQPSGGWPLSEPLFHYPDSGNAYAYEYETLAELIRPALPREGGRALRTLLKPYLPRLMAAWERAVQTRIPIGDDIGTAYGWSSNHHPFRRDAEAWATGAVYSFAQMLRCLVGHYAAEAAEAAVRVRRPKHPSPRDGTQELFRRGDTWAEDGWTVGRLLATMFLHPRSAGERDRKVVDPDAPIVGDTEPRSAILFGPPGTGKTTMVEALAGALGWQYAEVLASDFLAGGVDQVPARADELFSALMELDRCVVLFDEIDELIRDRDQGETDPFGRFLTTSMLPKIAKLWEQRRILFFVATNHVAAADPAIRRSSRFDAAILVNTPSLEAKLGRLGEQKVNDPQFTPEQLRTALDAKPPSGTDAMRELLVLGLLRWDQIVGLARRTKREGGDAPAMRKALAEMAGELVANEWAPPAKLRPKDYKTPTEPQEQIEVLRGVYEDYKAQRRIDESRDRMFTVPEHVELPGFETVTIHEKRRYLNLEKDDLVDLGVAEDLLMAGALRIHYPGGVLVEDGPMSFVDDEPAAQAGPAEEQGHPSADGQKTDGKPGREPAAPGTTMTSRASAPDGRSAA